MLLLTLLREYVNGKCQSIKGFSSHQFYTGHRDDGEFLTWIVARPGTARPVCDRPKALPWATRRIRGKSGARYSIVRMAGDGDRRPGTLFLWNVPYFVKMDGRVGRSISGLGTIGWRDPGAVE